MSDMIDMIKASVGDVLMPIMVTCDPLRDPPDVVNKYLEDFHPDIVGLTGTYEEIKATCKEYRVYFSTPPEVKPGEDYLVDHSIYFFLMGELNSLQ
jgi:protein SCO1/2